MKMVILESLGIDKQTLDAVSEPFRLAGHEMEVYDSSPDVATQIERACDADIIMIANMPLSGEVIRACPKLKFIDVAFTGVDHVDLVAAKDRGVKVSNASGYSNESVAELVIGVLLSRMRYVPETEKRCREGKSKGNLIGIELKNKTVGIIGIGAIGVRTAELCHAFGASILAYSRHKKKGLPDFIEEVNLETLLQQSDVVSLHCPLTSETRNLINQQTIALMKPGSYLVNAARGPIVNTDALVEALKSGHIAGAAIDVFDTEPPLDIDHPLLHSPNTIVTPHIAFATKESMIRRAEIVFNNLHHWLMDNQINVIL